MPGNGGQDPPYRACLATRDGESSKTVSRLLTEGYGIIERR